MLNGLGDALPIYSDIKTERFISKKLMKDESLSETEREEHEKISDTFKLILNSCYGLMGNDYSGLKNIKDVLSVTINGQLILQMLTHELMKHGINVVYQNTKS